MRQAEKVWPTDYQVNWLLLQSLLQQNKAEQAKAQAARAEEVKALAEREGELSSRKLSEQPLNPALHCEMGVLLLRRGQASAGEGWLHSALQLDPGHRPAHAALAAHYRKKGDAKRAEQHARRAGEQP